MTTSLQELKQKRLKWVEANRENGFDEGINRLLTELYPDNAHFIYELLQNAEDPKATEVSFNLMDSAVEFEHNGERLFTLKDVESITSIGNSTKRDDATSIGKFGVGFKAVFAYTNQPEIHSGDFHFRIYDLVVPETNGVSKSSVFEQKTRFFFPFNNPKKLPAVAVKEIETGLRNLSDNTLLFLSHIRKINYTLPNGEVGYLKRIDHPNGHIEIESTHPKTLSNLFLKQKNISHWLHFQKEVEVTDDDDKPKACNIAIAYSLVEEANKATEETTWKIVPLPHGQVSIYFPAEKENSNLRFHLHAPFASTVARDSVRDCKANHQLRDRIAELVVESLSVIRDQDMLTVSFLAVLPNPADNLAGNAPFYEPIRKAIVQAFKKDALTPMKRVGYYAAAEDIFKGPASISDIIDDEDLVLLLDDNYEIPMWVSNPPQRNQREDKFLESLDIEEWSWSELVKLLNSLDEGKERMETWLSEKDDAWLMRFYALLGEACSSQKQSLSLSNFRIVRVEIEQGDIHVIPSQAYFPSTEDITTPDNICIVKKSVYDAGRSDENKRLAKLFLEKIDVRSFDTKEIIKLKFADYDKRPTQVPAEYMADIKMFVEYWQRNPSLNIDLFKKHTFLRGKSKDEQTHWHQAHELYLDKPYADTGLKNLFNDPSLQLEKYKSEILQDYHAIPHFINFSIALGVMDQLEIAEYLATKMQEKEFTSSGKKTDKTVDKDYFLNHLEGGWYREGSKYYIGKLPFKSQNLAISYVIWKTVCKAKPEQLIARYVPNQSKSHLEKHTDAFFIKQLTNCAWVPDRDGNFLKPADLTLETLHPDFTYDDQNGWLTAVGFGTGQNHRISEKLELDLKAILEGFPSHEKKMQCAELLKEGFDPATLLAKYRPVEFTKKPVLNPERRKKGVLGSRDNAPSAESITRERAIKPHKKSVTDKAKAYLRASYTNSEGQLPCQCCRQEMPFRVGEDNLHYFEAVQCISGLEDHYHQNSLALCPTCAAMYKYACSTDDDEILESITEYDSTDTGGIVKISVVLAGEKHALHFVEAHWFDLKTVLE